jgi:hypothetical protein
MRGAEPRGARLIVYTPADSDSRDRLEKLAANL